MVTMILTRLRAALALAAALTFTMLPAPVSAHVELVSSSPAAGANLAAAPTLVTLTFDGELDPTASGFTVTDADGREVGVGTVDLQVADRNVMSGPVSVSAPGVYTVEWEVLGVDGHELSGLFRFGYVTDQPITGDNDSPDTAAAHSRPDWLTVTGLLLVALAGLASVRRAVLR